jgi:alpha-D-xyloside xylohydrolase
VRLNLMSDNIVQVLKLDQPDKSLTPSLMTVAKPCACTFTVDAKGATVRLKAAKIAVAKSRSRTASCASSMLPASPS